MPFAQAGDIRMHYLEAGDPAGEPLVLLHGWPQHAYMWRRVIPLLEDRFRIVAPDLRGFGRTDAPRSAYTKQELAGDVLALLDVLGLERVRLAGHDWGGYVVFLLALAAPGRVSALRPFSIVHPWSPLATRPWHYAFVAYQPLIAAKGLGPALHRHRATMELFFALARGGWTKQERAVYREPFRDPARAEAGSRLYRTWLREEAFGPRPDARLTVPTRLVVGRGDPAVHPSRLGGAPADDMTVEIVDGGHWLPEERPALVADRIA